MLSRSEFGLWFSHKGKHLFGFPDLLREMDALIVRVDEGIDCAFPGHQSAGNERMTLLRSVRQTLGQITLIITTMFDEWVKFENGKDTLTHWLNRRFIPTISGFSAQSFSVTRSVGIVEFDYHPDYQQRIEKVDSALYLAKMNGRNRAEVFR